MHTRHTVSHSIYYLLCLLRRFLLLACTQEVFLGAEEAKEIIDPKARKIWNEETVPIRVSRQIVSCTA